MTRSPDVVIVGAGHNGLVAATFLARHGLDVRVVEEQPVAGGAVRTERPFARAPGVGASTGAYLLGLMPPELIAELGLDLPLIRRDPHYFLPTTGARHLLFGSDGDDKRRQFLRFFSEADWRADRALEQELSVLRADVAPAWLEEPGTIEETAARYVRPALRERFIDLCRGSVRAYLARFGFQSDLLEAMYGVTDGVVGLHGSWDSPGSGMNFLVHSMCRLPDSDGTWMIVAGGMGTVGERLARAATAAGARIELGCAVTGIERTGGAVRGVRLADGRALAAEVVLCNADPFRMRALVGPEGFPADYERRLDGYAREGRSMKVNLCLSALPRFTCLPDDRGQYGSTMHLLPDEGEVFEVLQAAFDDAEAGRLPAFPSIEWYIHTAVDPGLCDDEGRHNAALFVHPVPYELAEGSWARDADRYVRHLLSLCDRFAPGTSALVVDHFALPPPAIERHFGITRGHIQHVDNSFGFADRLPYATPIEGLYACGAGCHPAGAVIGCAGHNAAMRVLRDLGRLSE